MKYKIAKDKVHPEEAQIFETIQGEGVYAGTPAFFIRLQGCSVGCFFCDEKETWLNDKNYHEMNPSEILNKLESLNKNLKRVVITGGEPTEQQLSILIDHLADNNYDVHVESAASGKYADDLFKLYKRPIWVTFSPKEIYGKDPKKSKANPKAWQHCSELKFVISNEESEEYLRKVLVPKLNVYSRLSPKAEKLCPVFIVPDWFNFDENKKRVLELCSKYPKLFRIGIQGHKYLEIL